MNRHDRTIEQLLVLVLLMFFYTFLDRACSF